MKTKRLYLSNTDKKLFGVCGGIGEYFKLDSTLIRLAFVIAFFCAGFGILPYVLMAIIMPKKTDDEYTVEKEVEIKFE